MRHGLIVPPAKCYFHPPVIFLLSVHVSTVFGYFYFLLTSQTEGFERRDGLSTGAGEPHVSKVR